MRRLLRLLIGTYSIIFIAVIAVLITVSIKLFIIFLILNIIFLCLIISSFALNYVIKKTNWYRNIFIYTAQFVSNAGYRKDLQRNYEIVNLGSNSARFAFFYESILGQNWSTGTQGLVQDLEILKYYFSYIKQGGIVLVSIVPFSSISAYLKYKPEYHPVSYHAKFVKILDYHQAKRQSSFRKASCFIKFPLLIRPESIGCLLKDSEKDNRLSLADQAMQPLELHNDADKWINGWKKEFDIKNLADPLSDFNKASFAESVANLKKILDFCLERNLKPVLIVPPVTKYLSDYFSAEIKEQYIYSFIRQANTKGILFLDYFNDGRFQDPQYYFNSFFLNLRGRKLFTKQVLRDLGFPE